MEDPNSTLLPYILESLSHKPELCDTLDNLCKEVHAQLMSEHNNKYGNIKNAVQRALSVGQSLGIITLTNETIRVPFNFRANSRNSKAPTYTKQDDDENVEAASSGCTQPVIGTGNPPDQFQPQRDRNQQIQKSLSNAKNTRSSTCKHGLKQEESEYMIVPPVHLRSITVRNRPRKRSTYSRSRPRRKLRSRSRAHSRSRSRRSTYRRRTVRR